MHEQFRDPTPTRDAGLRSPPRFCAIDRAGNRKGCVARHRGHAAARARHPASRASSGPQTTLAERSGWRLQNGTPPPVTVELGKRLAAKFVLERHFKCCAQLLRGIGLHGDTPPQASRTGCGVSGRPRASFDFLGQLRVPGTRHTCVGSAVPPSLSPTTSASALANGRASSTVMRRLNSHKRLKFSAGSRDELITSVGGRGKSSMRTLQPLSRSKSAPNPKTPSASAAVPRLLPARPAGTRSSADTRFGRALSPKPPPVRPWRETGRVRRARLRDVIPFQLLASPVTGSSPKLESTSWPSLMPAAFAARLCTLVHCVGRTILQWRDRRSCLLFAPSRRQLAMLLPSLHVL